MTGPMEPSLSTLPLDSRQLDLLKAESFSSHCVACGGAEVEVHCRVVCRRCGAQRDCSDP